MEDMDVEAVCPERDGASGWHLSFAPGGISSKSTLKPF
jgi:hypothetical protein